MSGVRALKALSEPDPLKLSHVGENTVRVSSVCTENRHFSHDEAIHRFRDDPTFCCVEFAEMHR